MTGIVQQMITLVGYGNHYLNNGKLPSDFFPKNPAFRFCNTVSFIDLKENASSASSQNKPIAEDPVAWMNYLKNKGCQKLRLYFQYSGNQDFPDYKSAGMVGGGGYWYIEANYGTVCDVWASRWEVTRQNDTDQNIWSVSYGLLEDNQPPTDLPCNLNVIKEVTAERLSAIAAFASREKLDNYKEIFEKALSVLESSTPAENDNQKQMIPQENYSLLARQLLFSADTAWVFGGMGSWNDLYFKDKSIQQSYEELSYKLYDNICVNILSSINSF